MVIGRFAIAAVAAGIVGVNTANGQGVWEPVLTPSGDDSAATMTRSSLDRLRNALIVMAYEARQRRRVQGIAQTITGVGLAAIAGQVDGATSTWLTVSGLAMAASGVVHIGWPVTPQERLWASWKGLPEGSNGLKSIKLFEGNRRFSGAAKKARRRRMIDGWFTIAVSPLVYALAENRIRGVLGAVVSLGVGVWRLRQPTEIERSWQQYRWDQIRKSD